MVSALLSAGCTEEPWPIEDKGTRQEIELSAEYPLLTRVADNSFEHGDMMGISIVTNSDQEILAKNVQFTYDSNNGSWKGLTPLYWPDDNRNIDVMGYYPYSGDVKDLSEYAFSVNKNQSNGEAFESSDLLCAKVENASKADGKIHLSYQHKMAGLTVRLEYGDGFSEDEWSNSSKQVFVLNTPTKCNIDLMSGNISNATETNNIIPYNNGDDFRAVTIPTTYIAEEAIFSILIDGQEYEFKRQEDTPLVSGKMHTFTIQVSKRTDSGDYSFVLLDQEISPWIDDNEFHEGILRQYITVTVGQPGTFASTLVDMGIDYEDVTSLKVTGKVNNDDMMFMGDMPSLTSINMKDMIIDNDGEEIDYIIPANAFNYASIIHLVLPDKLVKIEANAFSDCPLSGTIIFPEGLEVIGSGAFARYATDSGNAIKVLFPGTLKRIESYAFFGNAFAAVRGELTLPEGLEYVGSGAFTCANLTGNLRLPSTLKELGERQVFNGHFTGDLIIPEGVTTIPNMCFISAYFDGRLILPEGLAEIGPDAFRDCGFKGELVLPSTLKSIHESAFMGNNFSNVVLPKGLSVLGRDAFKDCYNLSGEIVIPDGVTAISPGIFMNCSKLSAIKLHKDISLINGEAFANCVGITEIICDNPTPPIISNSAFQNIVKGNVNLQVPKSGLNAYKQDFLWREFTRLTEYRNFVCRPSASCALRSGQQVLTLNADDNWVLEHKPSWVDVYPESGYMKTTITISYSDCPNGQERTDSLVFKLADSDVRTYCQLSQYGYQYEEDEIVPLQKHSKGNGINIYFIGDGWDAKDIANDKFIDQCNKNMEYFFGLPPYDRLREYFNVYAIMALSQESGISSVSVSRDTRLGTYASYGDLCLNENVALDYITSVTGHKQGQWFREGELWKDVIVIIPNTTDYPGITYYFNDGSTVSLCPPSTMEYPNDSRGAVQHEVGGHNFGKLADETTFINAYFVDNDGIYERAKGWGYFQNVSTDGKSNNVPWSQFIFDVRYNDYVDLYEGAYGYTRSIWRSEEASCMGNSYIPYYNTISRYDITRRVMELSGEGFNPELDFYSVDTNKWGKTDY